MRWDQSSLMNNSLILGGVELQTVLSVTAVLLSLFFPVIKYFGPSLALLLVSYAWVLLT